MALHNTALTHSFPSPALKTFMENNFTTQMMLQGGQHQAQTPFTSSQPWPMQSLGHFHELFHLGWFPGSIPWGWGGYFGQLVIFSYCKLLLVEGEGTA